MARPETPGARLNPAREQPTPRMAKTVRPSYNSTMGSRQPDGSSDRRWIILADDGRYVTLGRATDPTSDEIAAAEARLKSAGKTGYLAILGGSAYAPNPPDALLVRPLCNAAREGFEAAREAFRRKARERTAT